jgi:hypothetical protein
MNRSANLVLVEGVDDLHFVLHVLYCHGFERADIVPPERWAISQTGTGNRLELKPKGGFEKLSGELRIELTPTYLQRMAIIADADVDPAARWASIRDSLTRAGVSAPREIPTRGLVISTPNKPIVGIWLMPDNDRPGYIEHLLADMIDPTDRLWAHASACVDQLKTIEQRFPLTDTRKAEIHTWLAWQEQPGARLSEAVVRRYVDTNCAAVVSFTTWFSDWLRAT